MTKQWRQSCGPQQFTMAHFDDLSVMEGIDVSSAKPMKKSFPKVKLIVKSKHKPNDYFQVGLLFIASDRLKSIFEEFRVHAEYHPVTLVHRAKTYTESAFYCVRLLDHVDCLDWKKSKYTLDERKYADELESLTIDEKKAAGYPLFQLARVWGLIWLCSEELAQRIELEKRLSGMKCRPPETFRNG